MEVHKKPLGSPVWIKHNTKLLLGKLEMSQVWKKQPSGVQDRQKKASKGKVGFFKKIFLNVIFFGYTGSLLLCMGFL